MNSGDLHVSAAKDGGLLPNLLSLKFSGSCFLVRIRWSGDGETLHLCSNTQFGHEPEAVTKNHTHSGTETVGQTCNRLQRSIIRCVQRIRMMYDVKPGDLQRFLCRLTIICNSD